MAPPKLHIRPERPQDERAIAAVHDAAFGRTAEGEVVDEVRAAGAALLSLVGVVDGAVAGHVLFSAASVSSRQLVVALGPLAVDPSHQGRGVGTALVHDGLLKLRAMGVGAVVVLGDPRYYHRFGFARASSFGLQSTQAWPDEAFQALELVGTALAGGGRVTYHPAFTGRP